MCVEMFVALACIEKYPGQVPELWRLVTPGSIVLTKQTCLMAVNLKQAHSYMNPRCKAR